MYTPSYLDKSKSHLTTPKSRGDTSRRNQRATGRAIIAPHPAKVPTCRTCLEDGIGAVCIPFGCDRKLDVPKARLATRQHVFHRSTAEIRTCLSWQSVTATDYPDAPYSLYASRWPVPRPVKAFADLVASIRASSMPRPRGMLDGRNDDDAPFLALCSPSLTPRGAGSTRGTIIIASAVPTDPQWIPRSMAHCPIRRSARPPGLSHWFRYSLYIFQILRSTAGAVLRLVLGRTVAVHPRRHGPTMVDRVRVRASDTESVIVIRAPSSHVWTMSNQSATPSTPRSRLTRRAMHWY